MSEVFFRKSKQCSYNCIVTDNRKMLPNANAIIYHLTDVKQWDLPSERYSNQLYVLFNQEAPPNSGTAMKYIPKNFFNLTMTYRISSDIYAGYGLLEATASPQSTETHNLAIHSVLKKTKSALYLTSNCYTHSSRETYLNELVKYINVTRLGHCARSKCDSHCERNAVEGLRIRRMEELPSAWMKNKMMKLQLIKVIEITTDAQISAEHLFYLSFENSICRDYITEKLYNRMAQHLIPVVLKDSIYRDLLPKHSYIAADQFSSPAALAAFLKHLKEHPNELIEYVAWKSNYRISSYSDMNPMCDLCKYLYSRGNSSESKIITNIQKWWVDDAHCIKNFASSLLS